MRLTFLSTMPGNKVLAEFAPSIPLQGFKHIEVTLQTGAAPADVAAALRTLADKIAALS